MKDVYSGLVDSADVALVCSPTLFISYPPLSACNLLAGAFDEALR